MNISPVNRICPYCKEPNVFFIEEAKTYYCMSCYRKFDFGSDIRESEKVYHGSSAFKTDKHFLAVQALDLFTKIFCIKDNEDDLEFECKNCEFHQENGYCRVKMFASRVCPEYKDFGSMGSL